MVDVFFQSSALPKERLSYAGVVVKQGFNVTAGVNDNIQCLGELM